MLLSWRLLANHLNAEIAGAFDKLWKVRDEVLRELEFKRQDGFIGSSLEAAVVLQTDDAEWGGLLNKYIEDLPAYFIVSQVEIKEEKTDEFSCGQDLKSINILVKKAVGEKCARCWNYSEKVAGDVDLCPRCSSIV